MSTHNIQCYMYDEIRKNPINIHFPELSEEFRRD